MTYIMIAYTITHADESEAVYDGNLKYGIYQFVGP